MLIVGWEFPLYCFELRPLLLEKMFRVLFVPGRVCYVPRVSFKRSCHIALEKSIVGKHSVATISLNKPPVNSLDLALTQQFNETLKGVHQSGDYDALVLASSASNVFSAGLDLTELYQPSKSNLEKFWREVQDMWFGLYSSKLPTVAAINGHCLAGGSIIAAACDYRVAVKDDYTMGVTAAKVGVIAPPWFLKMLTLLIGQRTTELALQQGQVFTPDNALQIGLVDKLCELGELKQQSFDALLPFLTVFQESRSTMKLFLRSEPIESFKLSREKDMSTFVSFIMQDSVQERLEKYIQKLKLK